MLTNPEDSSQPADICQSPPAAADGGDRPSQLLGAFIDYLRARPSSGDSDSTRFDDGGSELEGVIRGISELGGVPVITLEPDLERLLTNSIGGASQNGASSPGLEPGLAERLQLRLAESAQRQEMSGEPAVLLVAPQIRSTLARFMRAAVPAMHVLAWNEIPDNRKVRLVTAVGR